MSHLLRSNTPCRRCWFGSHTVDWIRFKQTHRFFDGAFELRVVTSDHVLRPVLDVEIRCNPGVLYRPFAVLTEETATRSDCRAAVHKNGRVGRVNKPAPRAFADQRADLAELEH